MSALSSATTINSRVAAGSGVGDGARDESFGSIVTSAVLQSSGNHRCASSAYASAPIPVDATDRAAWMRSAGRCAVPRGIVTMNVLP